MQTSYQRQLDKQAYFLEQQSNFVVSGKHAGRELIEAYSKGKRKFRGSKIIGEEQSHPLMMDPFSDIVAYGLLNSVILSERDLSDVDLSKSDLKRLYLGKTSFSGSNFRNCCVSESELTLCDFRKADLTGASFWNCALMEVDFTGANLDGVCFGKTDLTGADFADAKWETADFSQAIVDSVRWYNHEPKPH